MKDKSLKQDEALAAKIQKLIDQTEESLEGVRQNIAENLKYYARELPAKDNGMTYVDNTCQASVDSYKAKAMDAFTEDDIFNIVPDDMTTGLEIKAVNEAIYQAMNKHNNRQAIFDTYFGDILISKYGIMKVCTKEINIPEMTTYQVESEDQVMLIVAELSRTMGIKPSSITASYDTETGALDVTINKKERRVNIQNIRPEYFLFDPESHTLDESVIVGHQSVTTPDELIKLGFEVSDIEDALSAVADNDDVVETQRNQSSFGLYGTSDLGIDRSTQEMEMYEVYFKAALESDDDEVAEAKLYQVFISGGVILSIEEVEDHPYVGTSIFKYPHRFIGNSIVDLTKHIQRALTGSTRDILQYNAMVTSPRFQYKKGTDLRAMMNGKPGVGVEVENIGDISPLVLGALDQGIMTIMDIFKQKTESGTGISLTGQSMSAEVLKAGAQEVAAQMVLSENQSVMKYIINTMMDNGIKPLLRKVYQTIRREIPEMTIQIDKQKMRIRPVIEWPAESEIKVENPVGQSAKLQEAAKIDSILADVAKYPVMTPNIHSALKRKYELMGITNAAEYLPTPQESQVAQQLQQLQPQLMQLQQQVQQLTAQNQQLTGVAGELAQRELALREQDLKLKEEDLAAKQALAERKQREVEEVNEANITRQAEELALKVKQTAIEAETGGVINFQSV